MTPALFWTSRRLREFPVFSLLFPRLTSFYRPRRHPGHPLLSSTPAGVSILALLLRNNRSLFLLKLFLFLRLAASTNLSHFFCLASVNSLLSPHIPVPNKFSAALSFHKEMLILPPLSEVDPRPRSLQRGGGWSWLPREAGKGRQSPCLEYLNTKLRPIVPPPATALLMPPAFDAALASWGRWRQRRERKGGNSEGEVIFRECL